MNVTRRTVGTVLAAAMTGSLLFGAAPAALASNGSGVQAERAAAVVEQATGAGDLASERAVFDRAAKSGVSVDGTWVLPSRSVGRIEGAVGGGRFSLGLPETKNVNGVVAGNGTVVYPDSAKATDLAVQLTRDGSVRALVTLKNRSAPTEHRFNLDLPSGVHLQPDGRGGFLAVKQDARGVKAVGKIDAPWAKDALGRPVATHYELEKGALVQSVEVNDNTAFPVVADPKMSFGWNVYVNYSKSEVKALYSKVSYLNGTASVCSLGGLAGIPCAVITLGVANKIKNTWEYAKDHGRCIELKLTYAGIFAGIKHYGC